MEKVLIACEVLKGQLLSISTEAISMVWLRQGLHRTPDQLRQSLQEAINVVSPPARIFLGYGMCSYGVEGIKAPPGTILVLPRCDDCISLSLGSREAYLQQFWAHPGTYYFTSGWVKFAQDPLKEYYKTLEKFDKETALWVVREMMKHYRRTVFIRINLAEEDAARQYARSFARFFELDFDEIEGSNNYLKKLLWGPWDRDFVLVEPGKVVTRDMFD